jgi:hypothetical protein
LPFPANETQWANQTSIVWSTQGEAFWDVLRLENNLRLLANRQHPIVHCDLDMIVQKDLSPLVQWGETQGFDMIFSRETWGDPLPICSGLYIVYPRSLTFSQNWLQWMKQKKYGTYSDQTTLRSYIIENRHTVQESPCIIDGTHYTNHVICIGAQRICILDMEVITRNPMASRTQYANHVNIDNVGGIETFLRFYNERIEDLPLTCRCGKAHLGNTDVCLHR